MPDSTPDPLEPLIRRWLQSDDPDAMREQLCEEHPELADALLSRLGGEDPTEHSPYVERPGNKGPQQVGPYHVLDTLGEGGMGTVYLAEQREPVQRRVALKLIKLGMDSKAVVRRFEQERQALSLMDHEGIAKVYDVGTSERGQPYFVMELVKGVPLDAFCEQQRLSLEARLQLMQQVCSAVQHAHQKGVIHRDLKPGNVLVSDLEGRLQIKIIDFGLAKAMGQKLIEESLFTELGVVMGTPEFMAPEQADPNNLDIDTRADVYSLGVMLYQLLVGQLPFSSDDLREAGLLGMQRLLREAEPPKPSTKLTTLGDQSTEVAQRLRVTAGALKKALKDDLDWVVVKALEKDRARRYQSASAVAEDLQRYLDSEPLLAGPPSPLYRLQKLVRRYRGAFAAAALFLLASLTFGPFALWQWRSAALLAEEKQKLLAQNVEARRRADLLAQQNAQLAESDREAKEAAEAALSERDEALAEEQQRADELEQVARFQQNQFERVDPDLMGLRLRDAVRESLAARAAAQRLPDAEVQALLAEHDEGLVGVDFTGLAMRALEATFFSPALAVLEREFDGQPLLQARLRQTAASVLRRLGRLELAQLPQEQAVRVRRRLLGPEASDTLVSVVGLGLLRHEQGDLGAAEQLYREALRGYRRELGPEHPETIGAANNLGALLATQGRLEEAEQLLDELLATARRALGEAHPYTRNIVNSYATVLQDQGRLAAAEALLRESLDLHRRAVGGTASSTVQVMVNLGSLLQRLGKPAEAEALLREALEAARRVLGGDHPITLQAVSNLGAVLQSRGLLDEAEPLLTEAQRVLRRVLGGEHPETLLALNHVASLLQSKGRLEDAGERYREALAGLRRALGDEHGYTLTLVNNLASLLREQGLLSEAEAEFRRGLDVCRRALGEAHPYTLGFLSNLAGVLRDQDEVVQAEALYRAGLSVPRDELGDANPYVNSLLTNYAAMLRQQERYAEAEPLYRAALKGCRATQGDVAPIVLQLLEAQARCLMALERRDAAQEALQDFVETTRLPSDHAQLQKVRALMQELREGAARAGGGE